MPFTLAHPAAVLPLMRGRRVLVAGALVVGSAVPDVPWFLPPALAGRYPSGEATHAPLGLVTVNLVAGLVAWGLWRAALRRPALALLPRRWAAAAARDTAAAPRGPLGAAAVAVSVVLGAATHLVLDAFTHDPGSGTGEVTGAPDFLTDTVAGRPAYLWLQWGVSAAGLALLAWWAWRWARRQGPAGAWPRTSAASAAVLALAGPAAVAAAWPVRHAGDSASVAVARALLVAGDAVAVAVLALAALWWAAHRWGPRGRPGGPDAGVTRRRPRAPATSPGAPPGSRTPG